jgi:CubicO group peptidase (beta-lactamase class C family)
VAGFEADALQRAERAIEAEVARGGFPGAALAIGRMDNIVIERGFGRLGWSRLEPRVDAEYTIYDLASLTKVVAATTAIR